MGVTSLCIFRRRYRPLVQLGIRLQTLIGHNRDNGYDKGSMSISPLRDLTVLGHLGGEVQQLQDDLAAQLVVPLVVLLGPITEILSVEGQVVLQPGSLLLLLLASQLLGSVCSMCVVCVCVCVCVCGGVYVQ